MLTLLYDHLAWADGLAREEVAAMHIGSAERSRAESIYAHIAGSEHNWLARLLGEPPTHAIWPTLDLPTAARVAQEAGSGLRALAEVTSGRAGAREVTYRNSSGKTFRNRVEDVLVHVALHGSYHRGQLALLSRQAGTPPALTDYIAFVRDKS
jgi:uncharacterized damage-inducible protein DinB